MDFFIDRETTSPKETEEIASELATRIKDRSVRIVCLYGELGAGKTVFAKGFAKGLGLTQRILSPTFIIVRKYRVKDFNYYHVDLYRAETDAMLQSIGIEELLSDEKSIILIEWAERLGNYLPTKRFDMRISITGEHSRMLQGKYIYE